VTIQRERFDLLLAYQPIVDVALHNFLGYDDNVIRRAFVAADRAAAAIGGLLDPARDALIVCGDHGLVRVEREVRLGRLLADQGLSPRWRVFTANNVAHFYRSGDDADTEALVNVLTASGHFERVEKKTAASHPNSGDIIATSYPGVSLSSSDEAPLVGDARSNGHHGALNTHRELHTVLFASGFGVPRGNLGEIPQTRIARFVAELLGIAPPQTAQ
jgi:hypothetical protein